MKGKILIQLFAGLLSLNSYAHACEEKSLFHKKINTLYPEYNDLLKKYAQKKYINPCHIETIILHEKLHFLARSLEEGIPTEKNLIKTKEHTGIAKFKDIIKIEGMPKEAYYYGVWNNYLKKNPEQDGVMIFEELAIYLQTKSYMKDHPKYMAALKSYQAISKKMIDIYPEYKSLYQKIMKSTN